LAVLEKGLQDLPRLLTTDASALSAQPQPQDADMLSEERADSIADGLARQMGCPPQKRAS
jgi:transcriptional regulator of met regulon